MRFRGLMILAVPGLIALSGCGSSSKTSTSATTPPTTGTSPVTTGSTVKTSPNSMGTILVDAQGKTLYTLDHDVGGKPTCTGGCAATWPPLLAPTTGSPTGVSGLGVMARPDGGQQVTYNNKPLYHYSGDTQVGETKGNGFMGIWHVVILAHPPGTAPTTAGSGGYGY